MISLTTILSNGRSQLCRLMCSIAMMSYIATASSETVLYLEEQQCLLPTVSFYLENIRDSYDTNIEDELALFHVVIGNEAADLDSICAAIARARYLFLESTTPGEFFYPVVNITRKELALRRDAQYLFSLLNVDVDSLIFVDEIPLDSLANEGRLKLHLVDHNALAIHQAHLRHEVVSIIDHHANELVDYPNCSEENKIVMNVGSATSLVASEFLRDWRSELDSSYSMMMLAPILLDTANLQSLSKTTQLDKDVIQELADILEISSLNNFYGQLLEARLDITGFTADMLLHKDMKRYQDDELIYTISSLPQGAEFRWDQDFNLLNTLQEFRKKQAVPIVMVTEISARDGLNRCRLLHINCESLELLEQLIHHFESNEELAKISSLERKDPDLATATWILPTSLSRKVLQPKLQLIN